VFAGFKNRPARGEKKMPETERTADISALAYRVQVFGYSDQKRLHDIVTAETELRITYAKGEKNPTTYLFIVREPNLI